MQTTTRKDRDTDNDMGQRQGRTTTGDKDTNNAIEYHLLLRIYTARVK